MSKVKIIQDFLIPWTAEHYDTTQVYVFVCMYVRPGLCIDPRIKNGTDYLQEMMPLLVF